MKIVNVVGARPNFIKIASIAEAIHYHNDSNGDQRILSVIVHTGQHYDEKMSKLFFDELEIPRPDYNLEVGSGSHAYQTAEIMKRFEPIMQKEIPDYVLVVGDVNSTIACALVAKKMGIKVIHVEAGLRSFDLSMPEEINRILTDRISDLLFITEKSAQDNLMNEGVAKDRIYFVGNVMIDTLLKHKERAESSNILSRLRLIEDIIKPSNRKSISKIDNYLQKGIKSYAVVTLHRPSNVDDLSNLKMIVGALSEISKELELIFPAHPRTVNQLKKLEMNLNQSLRFIEPLGYLDFLKLMSKATMVITDSGGIQEETTLLRVPCITLRENTERPVTTTVGTNYLVGISRERLFKTVSEILDGRAKKGRIPPFWDGKASQRIIDILMSLSLHTASRLSDNYDG